MRIGELCVKAGVSPDTVRYYERLGLLDKTPQPHASNNYKAYSALSLHRLRLIQQAKHLGFTLAEVSEVIAIWEQNRFSTAEKRACLQAKLEEIDSKARALESLRGSLLNALKSVVDGCDDVEAPSPCLTSQAG